MIHIAPKDSIRKHVVPFLSWPKRGPKSRAKLEDIVLAILYKLKTGCQWDMLPVKSFFARKPLSWQTVYYHFRKWTKDGSWKQAFTQIVALNRSQLDLSLAHFDGTHSLAAKGGKQVGYHHKSKRKTSNTLWLVDANGLVVSYVSPYAGNRNDLYKIELHVEALIGDLKLKGINPDGIFINADTGFDALCLRHLCERFGIHLNAPFQKRRNLQFVDNYDWHFDEQMYQQRYCVERTNAWMDAYRSLRTRFDTTLESWQAWHDLYGIVSWCKRLQNPK